MYITKTILGAACCLGLILTGPAFGDTLSYPVTLNTSSVLNTTGYIDFQLDPGSLGALGVTASISGFSGATLSTSTTVSTAGSATNLYFVDGAVSTAPASSPILLSATNTLNLMNTDSNNELTQALKFTTAAITFNLTFSGPGVSVSGAADGVSGSTFVLDFLNDAQTAYILSSDPTGSTASLWATDLVNISNTGALTVVENPGPGGGPGVGTISPEPSPWMLACAGLLILTLSRRMRKA